MVFAGMQLGIFVQDPKNIVHSSPWNKDKTTAIRRRVEGQGASTH